MPYASYARLTDDDIKALYAYFMQQVQPVDEPAANQTSLPFPYNMRLSMALWNALFLDSKPFAPDPSQSAEWNRGKYLVDGAAHCGECHTPRGLLMQQKPSQEFGGAVIGSWYAPNITPSAISGIGAMSADELFRNLKFGKVAGKAQAGGEMAFAVQLSFSQLRDEDLHAMVSYLRSVPPVTEPHAKSKFTQGQPFTGVASFRGVGGMSYDRSLPGGAAQLFAANCATCHGIAAQGSRDTHASNAVAAPTLAAPDKFILASSRLMQHQLSPGVGSRMAAILSQQIPSFDADLSAIIRVADERNARVVEEFFDALPEGRVKDTAHRITFGWYAGVVDDSPTGEVLAYEEALMYQPTKDAIALPTYSFNGPNNWTEIDPPLSAMPEF